MKHELITISKKHNLIKKNVKKYNLSQINKEKPQKFKLINPNILSIISNSERYNSDFEDPFKKGIKTEDLTYRMCREQKDEWINYILSGDERILKIKMKGNYVVLILKNITSNNNGIYNKRYMTFYDKTKGELDAIEKSETKKEKTRLHNVQNKPKSKRKRKKKIRRT